MASGVKQIWTSEMDLFLKENYLKMNNPELAKKLGLKITITRNRLRHLGLKRIEMEYFTTEQLNYLLSNYKTTGNTRMAHYLNEYFPKNKPWTKTHIIKKLGYLGLKRTEEELAHINTLESSEGGLRFTINQNSCVNTLHPSWVAQQIAWRNKPMQKEILKNHPELIEVKKTQILLIRKIKTYGTK